MLWGSCDSGAGRLLIGRSAVHFPFPPVHMSKCPWQDTELQIGPDDCAISMCVEWLDPPDQQVGTLVYECVCECGLLCKRALSGQKEYKVSI